MKTYEYIEYSEDAEGETSDYVRRTEEEILNEYWGWWEEKMIAKYGRGHHLVRPEICIEDWVVTHYAYEVK